MLEGRAGRAWGCSKRLAGEQVHHVASMLGMLEGRAGRAWGCSKRLAGEQVHHVASMLGMLEGRAGRAWGCSTCSGIEQGEHSGVHRVYRSRTRRSYSIVFNSSQLSRYCSRCWSLGDTILILVRLFLTDLSTRPNPSPPRTLIGKAT